MSSLINKKAVKQHILHEVEAYRKGWDCTRVSGEALTVLEAKFRAMINRAVRSHRSVGKTFTDVL